MNLKKYLESSEFIDVDHERIKKKANSLALGKRNDYKISETCFKYVRDEIKHSWDYKLNTVTCKASDVLKYKTGYCFAKSHLLAALLRANKIPAGLCYQRLKIEDDKEGYCLHGLNVVYLKEFGWYRIDPRGNFNEINAQFNPPREHLAFSPIKDLEKDFSEILHKPLDIVTDVLTSKKTIEEVNKNLPDIEFITKQGGKNETISHSDWR